jgi:hypothetical protein
VQNHLKNVSSLILILDESADIEENTQCVVFELYVSAGVVVKG